MNVAFGRHHAVKNGLKWRENLDHVMMGSCDDWIM
jgi:hypothetical protein